MKMETDFEDEFDALCVEVQKKVTALKKQTNKRKAAAEDGHKHLIINYLPQEMDEEHINILFGKVGTIDKYHLMRDLTNKASGPGISLGYGFVDYLKAEDGERAVEIINGCQLAGKTLKISYSKPNADQKTNIYISGLPKSFSKDDLDALFRPYGDIVSSTVIDSKDSENNIAFVRFKTRKEADEAIAAKNNTTVRGAKNPIQVRQSNTNKSSGNDDQKRRKTNDIFSGQSEGHDIYVFNLDQTAEDKSLWKLFGAFGAIKNATVVVDKVTQKCKGYGFVTMKNLEEAKQAIKTLNGFTHEGRTLQVSFKSKSDEPKESDGNYTLYVYNIHPDTEDTAIWKLFGQFGAVKNVKIIRDDNTGKAKGFAFITMKDHDEAASAVKFLNGFGFENRTLQVSFKTNKNREDSTDDDTNMNRDPNIPDEIATDRSGCVQIFVYNLAPETEEKTLWRLFGQFGAIKNVKVMEDKSTSSEYRGHAFVSMKDYSEACFAVNALRDTVVDNRTLQVSFKKKSNKN